MLGALERPTPVPLLEPSRGLVHGPSPRMEVLPVNAGRLSELEERTTGDPPGLSAPVRAWTPRANSILDPAFRSSTGSRPAAPAGVRLPEAGERRLSACRCTWLSGLSPTWSSVRMSLRVLACPALSLVVVSSGESPRPAGIQRYGGLRGVPGKGAVLRTASDVDRWWLRAAPRPPVGSTLRDLPCRDAQASPCNRR